MDKTQFLNLLTDFYKESCFHDFFKAHTKIYKKAIQDYKEKVLNHLDISWYESFYGNKPEENFSVIIGFCNGGGNYGVNRHAEIKKRKYLPLWVISLIR